jgi:large subunit ribosomal protein L4
MEFKIFDKTGKETGETVTLSEAIFGIEPNDHAIYLDVKQYQANQRQGTHKTKERAEISGSTRKIKRQKGTGTARAGSIKSPVFRGGGRVFGPRPRDYHFKLNKKLKRLARKSALSYKAKDACITIVDDFMLDSPKTKEFISFLQGFSFDGKKTLLITNQNDPNIYLSSRNLQKARVLPTSELSTFEILHADQLIITKSSLDTIETLLQ